MEDYSGEKLLDKLYKNLYLSAEVKHTSTTKDSKEQSIRKYLDRIKKVHDMANTEHKKELLKRLYFDKYVIKEDKIPNYLSNQEKKNIIYNQKESLSRWLNYLMDENSYYPMWAKYWAFQGMLKMGNFDEASGTYQKRSDKTLNKFVDANPEIIANCIGNIVKLIEKENIDDEEIEKIINSCSFSRLYTIFEHRYKSENIEMANSTDGEWIKYNQGSVDDAKRLSKSLENKNTGWCTSNEDMALRQLCGPYESRHGGDFYVYYTNDKEGNPTIPRIAIRMNGHKEIGEIRGIESAQSLEEKMESILVKKLKEMKFVKKADIDKNMKIIQDLRELSTIAQEIDKNNDLNLSEIYNLFEIKVGFGWENDPRVEKLQEKLLNKIEKNQINIASIIEKEKDNELKMRAYSLFVKMCPEKFISKIDDEDVLIHFEQYRSLYQIGMNIFDCASERLKNNREFVLKFLKVVKSSDLRFLDYLNEQLKNDKDIVMEAIVQMHYSDDSGKALKSYFEKVNKKFREDKDIMLTAIKYDGEYFEFVHEQLKNDKNFILEAIKRNKAVTKYIDIKKYSDDKEIIMAVHDLKYASDRLRDDEDVALDAIKHNQKYEQLEYVSGRLKNNEKFILCTIKKDAYPSILTLIDKRFSDNKQIALKVIRLEGIGEIKHISPRLKFNPAFVIESFVGRLIEKGR